MKQMNLGDFETNKKAIAIVSGGLDSVTMLYDLAKTGYDLEVLSFNYGSNHNDKELPLVAKHCEFLKIPHRIIDLPLNKIFNSSLLNGANEIPEGHYAEDNMKSTVVPFRNGVMLSIAVGYAENIGASLVFIGSHAGDRAQYPDCRTEFTQKMSEAATEGTYNKVKIVSPYNDLMKKDIVSIGLELGVPYEQTWSCYKGGDKPCGKCGTCVERIEAFYENNTSDPTMNDNDWEMGVEFMKKSIRDFDEKHK